ncbi:PQQ-binding-like beta-propeller repeat protein [Streptomyces sp. NPDC001508]|uniref:outer membrane protein assembly factor BamB family protein n=1 Tax=Streptomyces sp. NPDC001508 TaxID=3154656 RepID=UPI00332A0530
MSLTDTDYLINGSSSDLWERHVGPRWYSHDIAGLHIVAIDWNTWERGIDRVRQDRWIRNDIDAIGDRPWILLAHDNPHASFFRNLPTKPLAVLTGHWHTDRVTTHQGIRFINTPSALFAGLDHSAPSSRIITWDGIEVKPSAPIGVPRTPVSGGALWSRSLQASGRTAGGPVLCGDAVIVAGTGDEPESGRVTVLGLTDGEQRWSTAFDHPIAARPAVVGNMIIVHDIAGNAAGFDVTDGTRVWTDFSADPLRDWCLTVPAVSSDDVVVVGYPGTLRALDPVTGERRWTFPRPWPHFNNVPHTGVMLAGDELLLGAAPLRPALVAIEPQTGEPMWQLDSPSAEGTDRSAAVAATPLSVAVRDDAMSHLDWFGWSPVGPGNRHRSGVTVFPASGHLWAIDDGKILWDRETSTVYAPGQPAFHGDLVIAVTSDRRMSAYHVRTGSAAWSLELEGDALLPHIPFRRTAHGPLMGSPTVEKNTVYAPGMDGRIHAVNAATGRYERSYEIGQSLLAPPLATDDRLIVVTTDGTVVAVGRD